MTTLQDVVNLIKTLPTPQIKLLVEQLDWVGDQLDEHVEFMEDLQEGDVAVFPTPPNDGGSYWGTPDRNGLYTWKKMSDDSWRNVSEVRYYDRALSADEIAAAYKAGPRITGRRADMIIMDETTDIDRGVNWYSGTWDPKTDTVTLDEESTKDAINAVKRYAWKQLGSTIRFNMAPSHSMKSGDTKTITVPPASWAKPGDVVAMSPYDGRVEFYGKGLNQMIKDVEIENRKLGLYDRWIVDSTIYINDAGGLNTIVAGAIGGIGAINISPDLAKAIRDAIEAQREATQSHPDTPKPANDNSPQGGQSTARGPIADDHEYISRRLKEIQEERARARKQQQDDSQNGTSKKDSPEEEVYPTPGFPFFGGAGS